MMSRRSSRSRYLFPISLSLLMVLGYHFFLRADIPSKIYFTDDTILSLTGITDGDLLIAQTSECDSMDIAGGTATITIPDGKSFTLKTSEHPKALKATASGGNVTLGYTGSDFLSGDITGFTLSDTLGLASGNIVWGVPESATWYEVKANGSVFDSYLSDASSEISFSSGRLSSAKTFTLSIDTTPPGGSGTVMPSKPDTSGITIFFSPEMTLAIKNIPENIIQIAVSEDMEFEDASWEDVSETGEILAGYGYAERLYIKFRSKSGGTSDVITVEKDNVPIFIEINEGDIVKTADNPDVYIIKYKGGKRFRRLVLSPRVFESYQHLRWENIKTISEMQMDSYAASSFVQVAGDPVLYELFPEGDTGTRRIVGGNESYDKDSVYEINSMDRDSYALMR